MNERGRSAVMYVVVGTLYIYTIYILACIHDHLDLVYIAIISVICLIILNIRLDHFICVEQGLYAL